MPADKRKPSLHQEVERKFAVTDGTVRPSFDGLAAVAKVERSPVQDLDAVYFDTPDQGLARHRVTLRRRTGGPDAGWHLKLPAGADARTEVRLPLDDTDSVPDELRDVVLSIVRDRPLHPVARISTQRTVDLLYGPDGRALAEFCDDTVRASAEGGAGESQEWREWELELVESAGAEGDAALLDRLANRLFDAGAEPATHGSKLAKVLQTAASTAASAEPRSDDPVHRAVAEQVDQLLLWDRAVRSDTWDSVHQMRVVTRKIRSLLRGSEESFGITDDSWLLEELRLLAAILGVARDAEVLAEKYETALDGLPAELIRGPVRDRLVEGAKRRYHAGRRRSLMAMRSERYFRLLDGLEALVAVEPPPSSDGTGHDRVTVHAAYRKLRKAAKKAEVAAADVDVSAQDADEALHAIRKRAKQLRYTASALGQDGVAEKAKSIQSLLGDHQDSVVSRAHLTEQAVIAHGAGEDTFTYGVLYQLETDVADRSEAQLAAALKQLKKAVRAAD